MTTQDHKAQAQRLVNHLSRVHGVKLKYASALEAVAVMQGALNWNTLNARPRPGSGAQVEDETLVEDPCQTGFVGLAQRIQQSVESGTPLVFGVGADDEIVRKQLLRAVQAFPRVYEFWHRHAVPSKASPQCFCCGRSLYDVPAAVAHPELCNVHVCAECVPNPPPKTPFNVWLIDDSAYVAAESLESALTWYDETHGPCDLPEGRSVEPRALTEPIYASEDYTGPTKPLRQLVTEVLRGGGSLPTIVAYDRDVL